jgi:hypothetical protein
MLLNLLMIIFANWIQHLTEHFLWLLRLRPRVLVDISKIDLSANVFGYRVSAPIMIAPTARHKLAHPEGLNLLGIVFSQSVEICFNSNLLANCVYSRRGRHCQSSSFMQHNNGVDLTNIELFAC